MFDSSCSLCTGHGLVLDLRADFLGVSSELERLVLSGCGDVYRSVDCLDASMFVPVGSVKASFVAGLGFPSVLCRV